MKKHVSGVRPQLIAVHTYRQGKMDHQQCVQFAKTKAFKLAQKASDSFPREIVVET